MKTERKKKKSRENIFNIASYQVKNLKKLGKEQNLHERASSLPDLTAEDVKVVRRDHQEQQRTVESMADSFHKKRHSAYMLELYQRMMAGSNPPSPNTLSLIDHVLFQVSEGGRSGSGEGLVCYWCSWR